MKNYLIVQLLLIVAGLAMPMLFLGEGLGLNLLLFELILVGGLIATQREVFTLVPAQFLLGGWGLSALMYLFNHNGYALVVNVGSLLALVGLAQYRTLRFLWLSLSLGVWSVGLGPHRYVQSLLRNQDERHWLRLAYRWLRLSILPLGIVLVFFVLYCIASPAFANLLEHTIDFLLSWTRLEQIPIQVLLFVFGVFLAIPFVLKRATGGTAWWGHLSATMVRKRGTPSRFGFWGRASAIGLKKEYRMAIILFSLLNFLLLTVNLSDLPFIWFPFEEASAAELSQFVHAGTYALITTIVLAAILILYYYRGNLNFYPGNQPLRILATAWLAQNAWLALSVAMRNYRYVEAYGLTQRRIGVFVFLVLTLIGLWAVFEKVHDRKTMVHLCNRMTWAVGIVFLLMGSFNWDVLVTKFNIHYPSRAGIDTYYLFSDRSVDNLYILWEEQEELDRLDPQLTRQEIRDLILAKYRLFQEESQEYTWRSWNLPLARNRRYLSNLAVPE